MRCSLVSYQLAKTAKLGLPPLPNLPNEVLLKYNAFTSKSVSKLPNENYDRMEFLGDSFCEFLFVKSLGSNFPNLDTSSLRAFYLSSNVMAKYSLHYGLSDNLKISSNSGLLKAKDSADIFESFFGVFAYCVFSSKSNEFPLKDRYKLFKESNDWINGIISERVKVSTNEGTDKSFEISDLDFYVDNTTDLKKTTATISIEKNQIRVGKSLIRFLLTLKMFETYPNFSEGDMTALRDRFYETDALSIIDEKLCKSLLRRNPAEHKEDALLLLGKMLLKDTDILEVYSNICEIKGFFEEAATEYFGMNSENLNLVDALKLLDPSSPPPLLSTTQNRTAPSHITLDNFEQIETQIILMGKKSKSVELLLDKFKFCKSKDIHFQATVNRDFSAELKAFYEQKIITNKSGSSIIETLEFVLNSLLVKQKFKPYIDEDKLKYFDNYFKKMEISEYLAFFDKIRSPTTLEIKELKAQGSSPPNMEHITTTEKQELSDAPEQSQDISNEHYKNTLPQNQISSNSTSNKSPSKLAVSVEKKSGDIQKVETNINTKVVKSEITPTMKDKADNKEVLKVEKKPQNNEKAPGNLYPKILDGIHVISETIISSRMKANGNFELQELKSWQKYNYTVSSKKIAFEAIIHSTTDCAINVSFEGVVFVSVSGNSLINTLNTALNTVLSSEKYKGIANMTKFKSFDKQHNLKSGKYNNLNEIIDAIELEFIQSGKKINFLGSDTWKAYEYLENKEKLEFSAESKNNTEHLLNIKYKGVTVIETAGKSLHDALDVSLKNLLSNNELLTDLQPNDINTKIIKLNSIDQIRNILLLQRTDKSLLDMNSWKQYYFTTTSKLDFTSFINDKQKSKVVISHKNVQITEASGDSLFKALDSALNKLFVTAKYKKLLDSKMLESYDSFIDKSYVKKLVEKIAKDGNLDKNDQGDKKYDFENLLSWKIFIDTTRCKTIRFSIKVKSSKYTVMLVVNNSPSITQTGNSLTEALDRALFTLIHSKCYRGISEVNRLNYYFENTEVKTVLLKNITQIKNLILSQNLKTESDMGFEDLESWDKFDKMFNNSEDIVVKALISTDLTSTVGVFYNNEIVISYTSKSLVESLDYCLDRFVKEHESILNKKTKTVPANEEIILLPAPVKKVEEIKESEVIEKVENIKEPEMIIESKKINRVEEPNESETVAVTDEVVEEIEVKDTDITVKVEMKESLVPIKSEEKAVDAIKVIDGSKTEKLLDISKEGKEAPTLFQQTVYHFKSMFKNG